MGNEGDRLLELRITSNLGLRREINESNNVRLALLLLSVGTIRTLDLPLKTSVPATFQNLYGECHTLRLRDFQGGKASSRKSRQGRPTL